MADGTVGVKQDPSADRQIDNDTDGSVYRQKIWDAGPVGTWTYSAGVDGTVNVVGRVLLVVCHATGSATLTIDGGDSIIIPALTQFALDVRGNLTDPELVFTGTDSYFIEYVA